MIRRTKINELIDKIVENYSPLQIILFGSYAYGVPDNDSDIDLLILKNTKKKLIERNQEIRRIIRGIGIPVDLTVYTPEEFDEWKNVSLSFENKIFTQGKVLYMKKNKEDLIKLWFGKADEDLAVALIISTTSEYKDTVCFHCQQASEKYLKALMIKLDIDIPRTHDIAMILDFLNEKITVDEQLYDKADFLNAFAVEVRYPRGRYNSEDLDNEKAIKYAEEIKNWVNQVIKAIVI